MVANPAFAFPLIKDYEAAGAELVLFGSRDGVLSGDSWSACLLTGVLLGHTGVSSAPVITEPCTLDCSSQGLQIDACPQCSPAVAFQAQCCERLPATLCQHHALLMWHCAAALQSMTRGCCW